MTDLKRTPLPAVMAERKVREILANFHIPARMEVRHMSINRRDAGYGPFGITSGQMDVSVSIRPLAGAPIDMIVPVMVHNGEMLDPSIGVIGGVPHLLAQGTFDDILFAARGRRWEGDPLGATKGQSDLRRQPKDDGVSLWAERRAYVSTGLHRLARDVDLEDEAGDRRRIPSGTFCSVTHHDTEGVFVRFADGLRAMIEVDDLDA